MEFRVYSKSERLVRRLTADLVVEEPKKATLFVFPDPGPVSDVASAAQIVAKRGGIIVADGEVPQIAMARPEPWMFSGRCVCGSVWGPLSETGWYCPTCGARTVLIPWGEVDQLIRVLETGVSFQVTPRTDAVALTTWFEREVSATEFTRWLNVSRIQAAVVVRTVAPKRENDRYFPIRISALYRALARKTWPRDVGWPIDWERWQAT